ncbi:MAG: YeeE/YedE family protein [Pseudomonadaceae bacterium]|nr:YeeE/YedE family protein [Pseudomonadaceae bacterium]
MEMILPVVLGVAFGFMLDRVGATNPNYIMGMLRLSNLHLAKVILLAIAVASTLLMAGLSLGLVDVGHMSVKATYIGVVIGGALLGLGFALAGYCPGTGWTALATGRKDALWFVLGGLLGAAAYASSHAWWKASGLLDGWLGGKVTLGAIDGSAFAAVWPAMSGTGVGLMVAGALMLLVGLLPDRVR